MFGPIIAGLISDYLFHTHRPPVAMITFLFYLGFVFLMLFLSNEWFSVAGICMIVNRIYLLEYL
jgi:sugar phosphate permease